MVLNNSVYSVLLIVHPEKIITSAESAGFRNYLQFPDESHSIHYYANTLAYTLNTFFKMHLFFCIYYFPVLCSYALLECVSIDSEI